MPLYYVSGFALLLILHAILVACPLYSVVGPSVLLPPGFATVLGLYCCVPGLPYYCSGYRYELRYSLLIAQDRVPNALRGYLRAAA